MPISRGIDVSHHQRVADWRRLKGDHRLTWGGCKATEGDKFRDPHFRRNWANLRSTGLVRVAYHFAQPGQSSAVDQASRFLSVVDPVAGDLLCLDLERTGGRSPQQVNAWAKEFGDHLREHSSCTTVLYAGGDYYRADTGRGLSGHFDYWWFPRYATIKPVRRWPSRYKPRLSGNSTGWSAPAMWQWAESLHTYLGQVDANVSALTAQQLSDGPGGPHDPLPEGEEMPTELNKSWSGDRPLRPGTWVPLHMSTSDDKHGQPSIATGPLAVTGEVGIYLEGAPVGSAIQVRQYLVRQDGGSWVQTRSLGVVELVATAGTTFCRVPVTCQIPAGQRLRVKANAAGKAVRTFATLLTWKG